MIRFFICSMLLTTVVSILGTAAGLEFWERVPLGAITIAALAGIFWDDIPAEKE